MSQELKQTLPRGLVNREGKAVNPTQRLPSLRGDMSSPAAILTKLSAGGKGTPIITPSTTTRGGAAKRVYRPTIPSRRTGPSATSPSKSDTNGDSPKRGKQTKSPRGRGASQRGNARDKGPNKNFVQLEASVFNGINAAPARPSANNYSSVYGSSRETVSRPDKPSTSKTAPAIKDPQSDQRDKTIIQDLYKDDFIAYSDSDEDCATTGGKVSSLKPRGWDNLTSASKDKKQDRQSTESTIELTGIPIDKWLDSDDKLVLMQIPDILLSRPQGLLGKLRLYKSGRVELIDSDSGITFDVIRGTRDSIVSTSNVEDTKHALNVNKKENHQEVVSFSGDSLHALSKVDNSDLLLVVGLQS